MAQNSEKSTKSESRVPRIPRIARINPKIGSSPKTKNKNVPADNGLDYHNPKKVMKKFGENTIRQIPIEGPIKAKNVRDISSKTIVLTSTYVIDAEDEPLLDHIYALANSDSCVETEGIQKVEWKYVPKKLYFEQRIEFNSSVNSWEELEKELNYLIP